MVQSLKSQGEMRVDFNDRPQENMASNKAAARVETPSMLAITPQWHYLEGLAFGLQQSSLWGSITVGAYQEDDIVRLDQVMHALIGADSALLIALPPDASVSHKLVHRLVHWTGAVQRYFKIPVSEKYFVQQPQDQQMAPVVFNIALPICNRQATELAVEWLDRIVSRVVTSLALFDLPAERLDELDNIQKKLVPFSEPGLNKFSVVHAAHRLNIPVCQFTAEVHQLGTGQRARWMDSTITDLTPAISTAMARNKFVTASVLRSAGLPAPTHQLVRSVEEALEAAHQIGYPVVVKPADLDQGIGVAADLRDDSSVTAAYNEAVRHSRNILIEKWFDGFTHRLTVIEGQVIRVSKRIAGGVVGDGINSVAELVDNMQKQADYQRRARRLGKSLLSLDDEAMGLLAQNGFSPCHIPAAGDYVRLRRRDNVNVGGISEVCPLDAVHPDNLRLAIDATRLLRLDFAGIDVLTKDIHRSWLDIGALICEVNAKPQVVAPEEPRLYENILWRMFPQGARVPAHLVAYPEDADHGEAMIQHWTGKLNCNGLSSQSGLWVNGARATGAFQNGLYAARALFSRPDIRSAVCLMTLQEIVKYGLPTDLWDSVHLYDVAPHQQQDLRLQSIVKNMLRSDI